MIDVISVKAMRDSDEKTIAGGVPGRELMYRAGLGIFHAVSWKGRVAIVCGSGNNGGDGYVLASLLFDAGIDCTLFTLSDKRSADGAYYAEICEEKGIPFVRCDGATVFTEYGFIVDCIFGTGFSGEVTGLARDVIEAINDAGRNGATVVAVDINSGLDGNSGQAETAVVSDLTVSIGTYQPGHFLNAAKDYMRARVNIDIGIVPTVTPYRLMESEDVKRLLTPRRNDANKATYGYVALVGGSECYSGAIRLAAMAEASMRSGAGVTMVAAPRGLAPVILPAILESTFYPLSEENGALRFCAEELDTLIRRVKALAFGLGIGNGEETRKAVTHLLATMEGVLILDADGLNALARLPRDLLKNSAASVVLTPHPLEFARLAGTTVDAVLADPIGNAKAYAAETGAIVLLKGPTTVVSDGKRVILVDRGCPGMATAGSGDVLSGILAAVSGATAAGGANGDLLTAVAAAAYLNGRAGEIAEK
ncbi:MAG: NAD(P)H-hydrate dehydratase, partial [Clostridia bacterium]|nr:NAD(P)H-hydrate dehydratase [Clostridia bacterium]